MAEKAFPLFFKSSRLTDAEVEQYARAACERRGATFLSIAKHHTPEDEEKNPSPFRFQGAHFLITYDAPDAREVRHADVYDDAKDEIGRRGGELVRGR